MEKFVQNNSHNFKIHFKEKALIHKIISKHALVLLGIVRSNFSFKVIESDIFIIPYFIRKYILLNPFRK